MQLEWMSADIGRAFDLQRSNPFELRNVHIIHSLEELDELRDDPMVSFCTCFREAVHAHCTEQSLLNASISPQHGMSPV